MSDDALLTLDDVTVERGGAGGFVLTIPAFSLKPGEIATVTGPSGSGKSTALDLFGLVLRPARVGNFLFSGRDAAALWRAGDEDSLAALRARAIGYILQTGGLLPFLSVRDNIGLSPSLLGMTPETQRQGEMAGILGIASKLDRMPSALSIGERQRAAIARALAHRPALLLADEPTASLDPVNAEAVLALLLRLVRDLGAALILVSHDWDRARGLDATHYQAVPAPGGGRLVRVEAS